MGGGTTWKLAAVTEQVWWWLRWKFLQVRGDNQLDTWEICGLHWRAFWVTQPNSREMHGVRQTVLAPALILSHWRLQPSVSSLRSSGTYRSSRPRSWEQVPSGAGGWDHCHGWGQGRRRCHRHKAWLWGTRGSKRSGATRHRRPEGGGQGQDPLSYFIFREPAQGTALSPRHQRTNCSSYSQFDQQGLLGNRFLPSSRNYTLAQNLPGNQPST